MKYSKYLKNLFSSLVVIPVLLLPNIPSSADVRCDLSMKSCVDFNMQGEITVSVPQNTTRLAKDSIKICMPSYSINTNIDVVFVVDQSASMTWAENDPEFLTPVATTRAINSINTISPASFVGYLGFSNGVCDGTQKTSITGKGPRKDNPPDTRVKPLALTSPGHKDLLLSQTNYNADDFYFGCGSINPGGTNYYLSISAANSWLKELTSPNKDVIIFLTDGVQTADTAKFAEMVNAADSTFPTVYTLFLADTSASGTPLPLLMFQTKDLINLTEKTGGNFYLVEKAELVDSVMQLIVQETIQIGAPNTTTVLNTNNQSNSKGAIHEKGVRDREYKVNLDSLVALNLNANKVTFTTSKGTDSYTKNININVDGPAATTTGKKSLSNQLFDAVCYDKSRLIPSDKNFTPITKATFLMNAIGVVLQSFPTPPSSTAVTITSGSVPDEIVVLDANNRNTSNFAIGNPQPLNQTVEGNGGDSLRFTWAHPRDPRDNAVAFLPVSEAPVSKAWIIDGDGDGRGDSVFIQFLVAIPTLPDKVSDIHWPDNNSPVKQAAVNGPNPITFVNAEKTTIVIDLSQDQFAFGATGASKVSPPTLKVFTAQETIQDSIKPTLVAIEKKPSDYGSYLRSTDSLLVTKPDTLLLTLSEAITPRTVHQEPWKLLLLIQKATPMQADILAAPIVSNGGLNLKVIIKDVIGAKAINAGDSASLNPNSPYFDENNNSPNGRLVEITGTNRLRQDFCTAWRGGPVLGHQKDFTKLTTCEAMPLVDEATNTIVGHMKHAQVDKWVLPVGIDLTTGDIDFTAQKNEFCFDPAKTQIDFPMDCVASRLILSEVSEGKYIAHVNIYDNLGKYIRTLKQAFGYCGELDNTSRTTSTGLKMNDLVWNLKDINGDIVGTGVYIWNAVFRFADGRTKSRSFRMGFYKKDNRNYGGCLADPN